MIGNRVNRENPYVNAEDSSGGGGIGAGESVHEEEPSTDSFPEGHAKHWVIEVAPGV